MTARGWMLRVLPPIGAACSIALMGFCGWCLLLRLWRVLRGEEKALPENGGALPLSGMAAAALAMLLSRLLLYALAYGFYRGLGIGEDSFADSFKWLWYHWDVRHYTDIAMEGYTAVGNERLRLVFFPMLPALIRLVMPLAGGDPFFAGTAISLMCASCAAALLYALAFLWGGKTGAVRAVCCLMLNPMSVFLCCPYTEALFLMLTLASALMVCRGRNWAAALAGAASAFTRMPGVIIAGLMIIRLLEKAGQRRCAPKNIAACAGQVLLVFSGLFLYWGINWKVTGDPFTYLVYQRENWFQEPGTFFESTANTMHYLITTYKDSDWLWTWGFQLLCMFYGYALLAFRQKKLPFALAAYSFVYVAVVFAPTWLLSGARYLYGLITLPLLQASCIRSSRGAGAWYALNGALLALFVFGYTIAVEVL